MGKPKAKFRVGQPVEFYSTDGRSWIPVRIDEASYSKEEGWIYKVYPDNLWCLESEVREPKPPKGLTKREAKKLKPGTWIRIWWKDSEPTVALLLDRINDVEYVHAMYFNRKNGPESDCHACYDQIIEVLGHISPPE